MRKIMSVILFSLLALTCADAQTATSALERLDRSIDAARQTAKVPGINVAIGRVGSDGVGKVVYERGFGLADVENGVKATVQTRFRTASIAKPMTAVAVMQLAERGKLDLDTPFREIYPKWPKKRWPLTCQQLLGHLGGIRHYNRAGEASGTKSYVTLEASLDCFKADRLMHEPGTAYLYTTYGFTLLGVAVEQASGIDFVAYLQRHIWDVAGMKHSCVDNHLRLMPHRARGYQILDRRTYAALPAPARRLVERGAVINCSMHDTSMKIPGGGLRSTASDLVRFGMALIGHKLIKPKTRARMWTKQRLKGGKTTSYGLGFRVAM
ncbi:MAG: serine hydrolase domain-containing protein, partial [Planctomycetota bacterium]|nr:serine hydrolase domain-containing protein [Planctomycetota bacterium]